MQGSPQNMQINPKYKNVTEEIVDFFQERLTFCERHRIEKEQLLLDPGIGFGKNVNDNFKIINELYKFKVFGRPLFLGSSRKSFIGKTINAAAPQRILATAALSVIAYLKGAHIFRVHDVKENAQALKIALAVINN
jgi:dihydropteroate synthase